MGRNLVLGDYGDRKEALVQVEAEVGSVVVMLNAIHLVHSKTHSDRTLVLDVIENGWMGSFCKLGPMRTTSQDNDALYIKRQMRLVTLL